MARVDPCPVDARTNIVDELPAWLAAAETTATVEWLDRVPLAIWDAPSGAYSLAGMVESGEWLSLLRGPDGPVGYIRSRVADGKAEIVELAESPLAPALAMALESVKLTEGDSTTLRIVRATRRHAIGLWLHRAERDDEVIVLQAPGELSGARVSEARFFDLLAALPGPGATAVAEGLYVDLKLWGTSGQPARTVRACT